MVELKIGLTSVGDIVKKLEGEKKKIQEAVDRTITTAKRDVPPQISQAVRSVYNISAGEMAKEGQAAAKFAKKVQGPKINGVVINGVQLTYTGRVLTPIHFNMTPKKLPDKKRKYTVRVTIKKGEKKVLVGKYNTPVFLARASKTSKVYLPYQRVGKKRLPICQIKTVSIPQMIENDKVAEDIQKRIDAVEEKVTKRNFKPIYRESQLKK